MITPAMLSVDAARDAILALAVPTPVCDVAISDALGLYLASPMIAARTKPATDQSAMDGYAMRLSDGAGPWKLVGDPAGHDGYGDPFPPGSAVRIFTGSQLPDGADAILVQELAHVDGSVLTAHDGARPDPSFVRQRGMDFFPGQVLHPAGTCIGAAHIALALAAGLPSISVHANPRICVVSTGNELLHAADHAHSIPDTNGPMLAALAQQWGGTVSQLPPLPDVLPDIMSALSAAQSADIIVTSGGTSVGDHDLLIPALEALGADIMFWKISMRPGKPMVVARLGKAIVLGLPGNPVSAFVTAQLFLRPLIAKMLGSPAPLTVSQAAILNETLPANGPRTHFMRGVLNAGHVTPLPDQDSSLLCMLSHANCLILRDIDAPMANIGDVVAIMHM